MAKLLARCPICLGRNIKIVCKDNQYKIVCKDCKKAKRQLVKNLHELRSRIGNLE